MGGKEKEKNDVIILYLKNRSIVFKSNLRNLVS